MFEGFQIFTNSRLDLSGLGPFEWLVVRVRYDNGHHLVILLPLHIILEMRFQSVGKTSYFSFKKVHFLKLLHFPFKLLLFQSLPYNPRLKILLHFLALDRKPFSDISILASYRLFIQILSRKLYICQYLLRASTCRLLWLFTSYVLQVKA